MAIDAMSWTGNTIPSFLYRHLWATLFTILFVHYTLSTVLQYLRLKHVKGPTIAKVSKAWLMWTAFTGRGYLHLARVNEEYGSLARIGPNHLLTDDPAIIHRMSAARSRYTRGSWYIAMHNSVLHENVLSERDEKRHNELRSKLSPGVSGRENSTMEPLVDKHIQHMMKLISRKYLSDSSITRSLDLARIVQYFTLDVTMDLLFRRALGFLAKDSDIFKILELAEKYGWWIELGAIFPGFCSLFFNEWVAKLAESTIDYDKEQGKAIKVAREMMDERYDPKLDTPQDDLMASFVRHGLSREELETEFMLLFGASSDTTATALRCTLYYIITNPRVYHKVQSEIDAFSSKSENTSSIIQDSEAKHLPYLQACIKEGLRIWPPVTFLLSKQVPPEGDTLCGKFIPGGTQIGYDAWSLHHRISTYGEDAHVFRPERWLEAEGEQLLVMGRSLELVFGTGKYGCLGKNLAGMELSKVIFTMLRHFDISLVNPMESFRNVGWGTFVQRNMFVRVSMREGKEELSSIFKE
ncbi:MAG: hypothetical protein M1827_002711 [Pycnora praestabilis]|nr:MAG: hypothetical protein M1827_002711 [Pycnora praestabilis]